MAMKMKWNIKCDLFLLACADYYCFGVILQKKLELEKDLEEYETEQQVNAQYVEEFAMLTSEKENLLLLHKNLKSQLEEMKRQPPALIPGCPLSSQYR